MNKEMPFRNFLLLILCVTICLATSLSGSDEDSARDFIEHVLRIPNTQRVLNSVLTRLEGNRDRALLARERITEEEDCEEPSEVKTKFTETLQTTHEVRQLGQQKHYPICHLERKIRRLNTREYEYKPAYYEEVKCTPASFEDLAARNEICSSLGFSCVQWNKTIHLTRRRYASDCWETKTAVVPAGCECMWPVHRLGDMKVHV